MLEENVFCYKMLQEKKENEILQISKIFKNLEFF